MSTTKTITEQLDSIQPGEGKNIEFLCSGPVARVIIHRHMKRTGNRYRMIRLLSGWYVERTA